MKPDIFIRSYDKDAEFLDLCLSSIERNGQGYGDIVIVGDGVTDGKVQQVAEKHGIRYARDFSGQIPTGYIAQQYSKLTAHKHLQGEYIIYIDSDCVLHEAHDPIEEWFKDDKPILLYDEWDNVGDAKEVWLGCTTHICGSEPPYEFMRRLPLVYPRKAIQGNYEHLTAMYGDLLEYMKGVRQMSEFNVLGNYCWKYMRDHFTWLEGRENARKLPITQYWSHEEFKRAQQEYKG